MMLRDRLPSFMAELLEFERLMDAEQIIWSQAEEEVKNLHSDFSLFTLREYGAVRWEKILGLVPGKEDSLEMRKNRILLAYLSKLPYTYRALLRYLAQVTQDFAVDWNSADYTLFLRVKLAGYSERTALLAVLRQMLPANILLKLQTQLPQKNDSARITVGAATARLVRHIHRPTETKGV